VADVQIVGQHKIVTLKRIEQNGKRLVAKIWFDDTGDIELGLVSVAKI